MGAEYRTAVISGNVAASELASSLRISSFYPASLLDAAFRVAVANAFTLPRWKLVTKNPAGSNLRVIGEGKRADLVPGASRVTTFISTTSGEVFC